MGPSLGKNVNRIVRQLQVVMGKTERGQGERAHGLPHIKSCGYGMWHPYGRKEPRLERKSRIHFAADTTQSAIQ
jgi:hypothetical protein